MAARMKCGQAQQRNSAPKKDKSLLLKEMPRKFMDIRNDLRQQSANSFADLEGFLKKTGGPLNWD
jgi:hypothetical protein